MKKHAVIFLIIITLLSALPYSGCAAENGNSVSGGESTRENAKTDENNFADFTDEDATDPAAFLYEEKNGAITITGLIDESVAEIVVPSAINGYPVIAIGKNAFINRKNLRVISIPASVKSIGYGFLSGCSGLYRLTLPFTGAEHKTDKGLKDYNFGYIFGETPFVGGKSTMQFYHKADAEQVEMVYYYIPESLKEVKITGVKDTLIPYAAFYNCNTIDKIVLGNKITAIGEFAFSGVVGKICWEDPKIETIGEHAFEDFKGEELTIPNSVTEIKRSGYSDCVNVKSLVVPDSVKKTDIYAFSYCYELQSISIGKNVEKLGVETFYFCINLKTVVLPDGLQEIEDGAFDSCKALERIELPATVKRINANAFKNCEKLKTVVFKETDGWRYYGLNSSGDYFSAEIISDAATAARYLTDTFRDYIWEKVPR